MRRSAKLLTSLAVATALLLGFAFAAPTVWAQAQPGAAQASALPFAPVTKPDGSRWRIGYHEGGQFPDYEDITKATVRSLIKLGWMESLDIPRAPFPEAGGFWRYLTQNARSRFLEFVPDAYTTAGDFDPEKRPLVKAGLIKRLSQTRDIDLMIAMGTWAGQDLANADHSVPTVVASTSDPLSAKIIRSVEDSGFDHIHAKVEPDRYQRQLRLFNDILPFRKLGIVYEDSPEGRTFGGVAAVEEVARERGFQIVSCFAPFNGLSRAEAEKGAVECYRKLAGMVDAIYVSVHRGVTARSMPDIWSALAKARVPSFSMLGSVEVRRGIMVSIAQADFSYVGQFHAQTIGQILNGAKPRQIRQRWEDPAKIAINLKTAQLVGFNPPVDLMLAADEIYEAIEEAPIPRP